MRGLSVLIWVVGLAFVSVAVGTAPVQAATFSIPCTADGCPDLVLATKRHRAFSIVDRTFLSTDCAVQEGMVSPGDRTLIRFAVSAANVGEADLVMPDPESRPDLFQWSPCHGHFHFRGFAVYSLWLPEQHEVWQQLRAANPDVPYDDLLANSGLTPPVTARKLAFCMEDSAKFLHGTKGGPKYTCQSQGIQAGWLDEYKAKLDGQWLDITEVPPGHYVLDWELNPDRTIEESSFGNNAFAFPVKIPNHHGRGG